jgi:hypothetical protein
MNLTSDLFWVSPISARGRRNGSTWRIQKPKYKKCEYDPEQRAEQERWQEGCVRKEKAKAAWTGEEPEEVQR